MRTWYQRRLRSSRHFLPCWLHPRRRCLRSRRCRRGSSLRRSGCPRPKTPGWRHRCIQPRRRRGAKERQRDGWIFAFSISAWMESKPRQHLPLALRMISARHAELLRPKVKDPSSEWWTSLWVRNARVPISKVEVQRPDRAAATARSPTAAALAAETSLSARQASTASRSPTASPGLRPASQARR